MHMIYPTYASIFIILGLIFTLSNPIITNVVRIPKIGMKHKLHR